MTLDDRSLREHLDRRAEAGASDVEQIADAVMSRVTSIERDPWWRRFGVRAPAAGVAVAALAVLALAVSVLPPRIVPGPGASPTSPEPTEATGYPAVRAMTAAEFEDLLFPVFPQPGSWAGAAMIVDVEISEVSISCPVVPEGPETCPTIGVELPGHALVIVGPAGVVDLDGPYAFRLREAGGLELLGAVRPGPDGLAWTLPQLTAELPDLRASDRAIPFLYLADAWRAVSTSAYRCPLTVAAGDPDFGCGTGVAWLLPDEASLPSDFNSAPPGSLRVPNVESATPDSADLQEHGYWLVDPLVAQDEATCFLCPPAGAVDLMGRVLTVEDLGVTLPTPQPRSTTGVSMPSPAVSQRVAVEIGFSTGSMALDGSETGDVTVSIEFTGPAQPDPGTNPSLAPLIYLERDAGDTGDPSDPHVAQLVRAMSPTPVAGEWTATFRLTSGDRGTWRVGGIVAYDIEGHELDIDPAIVDTSPTLNVIGTHAPHLTMERKPTPAVIGVTLQIFGELIDEDTGDPVGDVVVTVGQGDACAPGGTGATVTTNSFGWYKHVIPEADGTVVCAWVSDEPGVFPSFDAEAPIALYAALFAEPTNP